MFLFSSFLKKLFTLFIQKESKKNLPIPGSPDDAVILPVPKKENVTRIQVHVG